LLATLVAAALTGPGCGSADEERIELLPSATGPEPSAPRCSSDQECAVPLPYCDPDESVCVECLTDTNCGKKVCEQSSHTCQDCQSSGDCSGSNPYCSDGDCVECLAPGNCPEPNETCDTVEKKCVLRCAEDADCTDRNRVLCALPREVCVECLADGDCDASKPRCVSDKCHECTSDDDCAEPEPYCRLDKYECKQCLLDAHCDTGLRCDNYSCKE
jgi:hypothetical protein